MASPSIISKYWPSLFPLERDGVPNAGNWLRGVEFAKRYEADGVVSVPYNPGHLRSDLYRHGRWIYKAVLKTLLQLPYLSLPRDSLLPCNNLLYPGKVSDLAVLS